MPNGVLLRGVEVVVGDGPETLKPARVDQVVPVAGPGQGGGSTPIRPLLQALLQWAGVLGPAGAAAEQDGEADADSQERASHVRSPDSCL